MKHVRKAFIRLAYENPEIRSKVLPVIRSAAWGKLPRGWTQESVDSFWDTLTGEVKHKVTKCIKEMDGKVDDPGAFCASLADKVDPGWRSRQASAYDNLGTPFRFEVIPGRLGVVYAIEIHGSHYRIAPEREHWRLDRLGMMGRIWEAVTPVKYDFPEEAAQDLHRKYKARKLSSRQASSSEATLRKLLSKKVFEVRDGDETWTESGWDVAKANMEDEEVVEFLLTAKKGAAFGGGHSLELRRIK